MDEGLGGAMNGRDWLIAVIACVTDFVLAAGGAFSSVAVATDSTSALTPNAIAVVLTTGLLAAARRLQAMVALPPMTSEDLAVLHTARASRAKETK